MHSIFGNGAGPVAALLVAVLLAACGGSGGGDGSDPGGTVPGGTDPGTGAPGTGGDTPDPGASAASCDFETVDGKAVFEAESLPVDRHDDWEVNQQFNGFVGSGYIEWVGVSHFNDPTHGVMSVAVRIEQPGRYRLQWHTRIGKGDNPTEHNDTWVKFPDAADYYGLRSVNGDGTEVRRYPKPICRDDAAMDALEARADIDVADCVDGSSKDGWLKVYSSGARDWKWSARTSDNDASHVLAEFDAAGVYEMRLAARSDHSLIDRIVLHEESLARSAVQDLTAPETVCPG